MKLVPETFKEYYDYEVEKSEKGYGMPDFVIDKVVDQCVEFVNDKEEHFLITTFPSRITKFNLTEQETYSLIEEDKIGVKNVIEPVLVDANRFSVIVITLNINNIFASLVNTSLSL